MYLNPLIFILLIGSVVGLAVVILFIIQSYNHFLRKMQSFEEEKASLHDALTQKASNIIKDAHEQHTALIASNQQQVSDLANEAKRAADIEAFRKKLDALLSDQKAAVEKISEDFRKYYKNALAKLASDDVESVIKISKDIEDQTTAEMKDFTKTLREQTVDARKVMQEHVEEEYAKVEREIAEYKRQELVKIEQALYPLLTQITSMIIGRALDPKEHEKLIHDAITEAAKDIESTK
jgi:hypothetical protein